MPDFTLSITQVGSLGLSPGTRLLYHETRIIGRLSVGLLYPARLLTAQEDAYAVLVPHRPDALSAHSFARLLALPADTPLVPQVALATHPLQEMPLLLLPLPTQTLADGLITQLNGGRIVAAERLLVRAAIDYTHLLIAAQRQGELPRPQLSDLWLDSGGQVRLLAWRDETQAEGAGLLLRWASLWHEAITAEAPRLPLALYDDTRWQNRRLAYLPEGLMSLGLRSILFAALQSPPAYRFGSRPADLQQALLAWERILALPIHAIDSGTAAELDDFVRALPLGLVSPAWQQAIWHDWVWRARLGDTQPFAKRSAYQQERAAAITAARNAGDLREHYLRQVLPLLSNGDFAGAQALTSQWQQNAAARAQQSDLADWLLWQHLGRWGALLATIDPQHPASADIAAQVGGLLHSDPQADSLTSLQQALNLIASLPPAIQTAYAPISVEINLRRAALATRSEIAWGDWRSFADSLGARLATLFSDANAPTYLRLPVADDGALRPYTLVGRMVGLLMDSVQSIRAAISARQFDQALLMIERAERLAISATERDWVQRELGSYQEALRYIQDEALSDLNWPQAVAMGAALLEGKAAQHSETLRESIERRLLALGEAAREALLAALANPRWASIRAAHPAYRLHTESTTRDLLDRLGQLHAKPLRRLEFFDALERYHQLYSTYHAILQAAQHYPLLRLNAPQAASLEEAQRLLTLLQQANALGIPMDEFLQPDESTRAQWQQMIQDALSALSQAATVSGDIEQMKQRLDGDAGLEKRLSGLIQQVSSLQSQVEGGADVPGLAQLISTLRAQLGELERTYSSAVQRIEGDLKVSQMDMRAKLEAHDVSISRHSAQMSGTGNLLEDARQRLGKLERSIDSARQVEADLLCAYLGAMPAAESFERLQALLDALDSMVYALRRCPPLAYDTGCHETWMRQFQALKARFDALVAPGSKLMRRERRWLKDNLRAVRALFSECEEEARAKFNSHRFIDDQSKGDA